MKVELYPHQQKAVEELGNGKILRGDPGTGKSMTALAYFYTKECGGVLNDWGSLKTPKDLYIITTAKKRNDGDWQRDAYYLGLMEDPTISVSGVRVTVDSWNNIEKYVEVENAFFVFDEQKVVGSGLWARTFLKLAKRNRWILLSATPGDVWMDYAKVFIANGFYKNITEFKQTHVVYSPWHKFPKILRYNKLGQLVRNQNAVLVEMHYQRHTTRHVSWVEVEHDAELLERVTKKRWHVYEERPLRDVAELFSVARKVVNSDASRLTQLRKIQAKHKRVIVFYNFDYELEILRTLVNSLNHTHPPGTAQMMAGSKSSVRTTQTSNEWDKSLEGVSKSSLLKFGPTSTIEYEKQNPWDYLLSPEGMASNTSNGTSTSTYRSTPATSSSFGRSRTLEERRSIFQNSTVLEFDRTTMELRRGLFPPPTQMENWEAPKPPSGAKASSGSGAGVVIAEHNGHKHEPVPTTNEWIYLVQYMAGAEAWNCTTTDTMVFWSMTYSYKQFEQGQGRIDRLNTPFNDLYYHVLYSDSWIDKLIRESLASKQDFNEARYRGKMEKAA